MVNGKRPTEILLVEDNPADARLTQEALKHSRIDNNLNIVKDGEEALAYLRHEEGHANSSIPDLILLDLNMPRMDGRALLEQIKNDDKLKIIPVIIMTTSRDEKDIKRSYEAHANCYIRKPLDVNDLFEVVKSIGDFWFNRVVLPTRPE